MTVVGQDSFAWLRDIAWPFWLEHGIDRRSRAFHEHLRHEDAACGADFRRLRVVTRQITVFGEAAVLGLEGAADAVALGLAFLDRHAGNPDTGYAWRFDLAGRIVDDRRDLYDHAFVLLALAKAAPALPARAFALHERAVRLDAYLQSWFRHPLGGYVESLPETLPRRQNPHMHLFEAYLAAYEAFGAPVFLARADELAALMLDRLFQWAEGALPEYFTEDLAPLREAGRFVVEPGHHAEWVWLLDWHDRLGGTVQPRAGAAMAALLRFLDAHGIHPRTGALVDELWSDGTVKAAGSRLWPQTEYLKAELVRPDADPARAARVEAMLMSYVANARPGLWFERRSEDGRFSDEAAPASSLYHLTGAITLAYRRATATP
ncbi:MAG TPA: AGE family epimerase/isomerase [Stellaceae bacterium]|nr:AGE family epimerase/isomerase [Stellaceae bacterium]